MDEESTFFHLIKNKITIADIDSITLFKRNVLKNLHLHKVVAKFYRKVSFSLCKSIRNEFSEFRLTK